jgi:hypothetical protein
MDTVGDDQNPIAKKGQKAAKMVDIFVSIWKSRTYPNVPKLQLANR